MADEHDTEKPAAEEQPKAPEHDAPKSEAPAAEAAKPEEHVHEKPAAHEPTHESSGAHDHAHPSSGGHDHGHSHAPAVCPFTEKELAIMHAEDRQAAKHIVLLMVAIFITGIALYSTVDYFVSQGW